MNNQKKLGRCKGLKRFESEILKKKMLKCSIKNNQLPHKYGTHNNFIYKVSHPDNERFKFLFKKIDFSRRIVSQQYKYCSEIKDYELEKITRNLHKEIATQLKKNDNYTDSYILERTPIIVNQLVSCIAAIIVILESLHPTLVTLGLVSDLLHDCFFCEDTVKEIDILFDPKKCYKFEQ